MPLQVLPRTTVEKWHMPDPIAVVPSTPAIEALELMAERGIHHLPVIDAQRRVVGVLSHNDLRAALPFSHGIEAPTAEQRAVAERLRVGTVMSHAPETISSGEPLERAARRLAERHLGCLPVVDSRGCLVGMFTETDALRALVSLISSRGEVSSDALEALVAELQRERWRLRRQLEREAERRRERTGVRREPADAADRSALRGEEVLEEPLEALAARRLAALDHALARAARGQLGTCERCGGPIPPARLRALPGATTCVTCSRGELAEVAPALEPAMPVPALPGGRVHTPQGEGVLLRIAPFGTCGSCGEIEGRWDDEENAVLCTTERCGLPLTDVEDVAVVELGDGSIPLPPELLRPVDPEPYE
jgi:RNA polymerase-binding transcription factor DksA